MSLWRMIWQEIAHRKMNFVLGLFSVVVAIGTLAGVVTLLKMDKLRAEESASNLEHTSKTLAETSKSFEETSNKLEFSQKQWEYSRKALEQSAVELEDEMRKITKGLGFNILILSQEEDLQAIKRAGGAPQKTITED
ncbi:MAG: hypothetical protein KDA84_22080, partial [Planctomycetaceae bacterium]|nr:hypothetical protein [Planctomycetaceae bacterium]